MRTRTGFVAAVAGLALAIGVGSVTQVSIGGERRQPMATPTGGPVVTPPQLVATPLPMPSFVMDPTPELNPTGGPFIGEGQAMANALLRARVGARDKQPTRPVLRTAVGRLTYGEVVTWMGGSRTYRIDLRREVYLVVLSTTYQPRVRVGDPMQCNWVGVVVDATDGTPFDLICGPTPWPLTLPPTLAAAP